MIFRYLVSLGVEENLFLTILNLLFYDKKRRIQKCTAKSILLDSRIQNKIKEHYQKYTLDSIP